MKIILTQEEVHQIVLDGINRRLGTAFNTVTFDMGYGYIRNIEVTVVEPEQVAEAITQEVANA